MKHNQEKIANKINALHLQGVEAVGDDGSVCVRIRGNTNQVRAIAGMILDAIGNITTTDGVQDGSIFINGEECGIHDELQCVAL